MGLVNTKTMLKKALKEKYAVGAFNINNLEIVEAIINVATKTNSPAIIQVSEGARKYAGTEQLASIVKTALELNPKVTIALHQDHGHDFEICKTAIDAGFNSVMIDASHLPFEENVALTKKVVDYAHKYGVPVEAELGELVGAQFDIGEGGGESEGKYTDPQKAKEFVKRTGCDSLAVSIGTSHGVYKFKGKPKLDLKRLEEINKTIPKVPLVLHGASSILNKYLKMAQKYGAKLDGAKGVPETTIRKATAFGITKVNVDSDIRLALTATIRKYMAEHPEEVDPRKYLGAGRDELEKLIVHKFKAFGCLGKA
jgi:fructose-bisphosphate aldolase class II